MGRPGPESGVMAELAAVVEAHRATILASLIRILGDFDLAEDALQDALAKAAAIWPRTGVPASPAGWLHVTARRSALDRIRREQIGLRKLQQLGVAADTDTHEESAIMDSPISDDRLRLIFTCCHPALAREASVALTLRTLCGLSTAEIAAAFLVPEPTMAQRLVRAKRKIHDAGIPYEVPSAAMLPERTAAVLSVVYLVFTGGYAATSPESIVRRDLCSEAIRLARVIAQLMPDEPEALGLLALLLLQDSRRDARQDTLGRIVLLQDQDRSKWDHAEIREGVRLLDSALAMRRAGAYQVQAAIAAIHAEAESPQATDWSEIAMLYARLARLSPSPVVELNRAVAIAMVDGPAVALALLKPLAPSLDRYQPFHAARADLLMRLDRTPEAAEAYRRAIEITTNDAERSFLASRLARCAAP